MLLPRYSVAMVTYYATKITIIGSLMVGDLRDTSTLLSLDKQRKYGADLSKYGCWKSAGNLLPASLFNFLTVTADSRIKMIMRDTTLF